ncbi:hypothetical protein KP509_11G072700 [Ceratopteris richardii]|uniref:3-hydroxyisobutyryl-CoA hydrolase n=1 Tax=Ceratopteris richardii TaxID=49495 RepID=A0A8T2TR16_CERRI|nr:hypothetical protein KP509_11G072700 [Ceratopteris richardii]KAH7425828.1 hypothetical protein KP509_11G072700 [Ceratopteris richardii]
MEGGEVPDYLVEVGLIEEEKESTRVLTLSRPKKLNCITLPMVRRLCDLYESWETSNEVKLIILKGAGRAFCAGGDLRLFYKHGKQDDGLCPEVVYRKFWLDVHLHTYKKPMVALLHALVMGGGAGLMIPCRFKIATEKTVFSMPEASIGYHTDVGASYFLSHLPGHLGEYLAVTGARIDGAEMVSCGLVTHFVYSDKLQELEDRLLSIHTADEASISALIDQHASPVKLAENSVMHSLETIDKIFSKETVEEILDALIKESLDNKSEWIKESIKVLKRSSPTGVKMTFQSIRQGRSQTFAECMRREFRLTMNTLAGMISDDLYEGIRAIVIDKDNAPKWNPAAYTDVTQENLSILFREFGDPAKELQVPSENNHIERWNGKYETTVWCQETPQ